MSTPYRDGKPLTDVIPPDRRRQRAILMIVCGMIGGAILIEGARLLMAPAEPPPPPPPPRPTSNGPLAVLPGPITPEEVSAVVARHKAELRDRCFSPQPDLARATVNIEVAIGSGGEVVSTHYEGTDARVAACVEREVRQWRFPAHTETGPTARIPISFERS